MKNKILKILILIALILYVMISIIAIVIRRHEPKAEQKLAAGPATIYAPIVAKIEVENPGYFFLILCTNMKTGIYVKYNNGSGDNPLRYPPLPILVDPEVSKMVNAIPQDERMIKLFRSPEMSQIIDQEVLNQFIAQHKIHENVLEQVSHGPCGFRTNEFDKTYPFPDFFLNKIEPKLNETTERSLGGDSWLFPNKIIQKSSITLATKAQYTYKGKVLIEQDWYAVNIFTESGKGFIAYDGDYVVFSDYPYAEKRASDGKWVFHWYVIEVPKDEKTLTSQSKAGKTKKPKGRSTTPSSVKPTHGSSTQLELK